MIIQEFYVTMTLRSIFLVVQFLQNRMHLGKPENRVPRVKMTDQNNKINKLTNNKNNK